MSSVPHCCTILILGPTASGKSALALALAARLTGGGECVCADSMQVYRGMDIGTAKPTSAQRAAIRHHALDLVEPDDDSFTVERWLRVAERSIEEIHQRGKWPIVVGGTNLYVKALLDGLFEGPSPDAALRAELQQVPPEELRRRLEAVDPVAALRIHPNDQRRTIRALEVHSLLGQPISSLQVQWDADDPARLARFRIIVLEREVEALNRRINDRVRQMMAAGLLEEVAHLHAGRRLGRQAIEGLGYRQLVDHLDGRSTLGEAVEQIKIRTRRYGKQQRTWLRRFRGLPNARVLRCDADLTELHVQQTVAHVTGTA